MRSRRRELKELKRGLHLVYRNFPYLRKLREVAKTRAKYAYNSYIGK